MVHIQGRKAGIGPTLVFQETITQHELLHEKTSIHDPWHVYMDVANKHKVKSIPAKQNNQIQVWL
jgi:hypothetical protein